MPPSDHTAYEILDLKRSGGSLSEEQIGTAIQAATDGSWEESQLGAFLMAVATQGLDAGEMRSLTLAMMSSGSCWEIAAEIPGVVDKHSTGGVGDKVSIILAPLLASCGVPVGKLTGRGLGHTGGTADKLESIPGLQLDLDRRRTIELLRSVGMAVAIASRDVAPADKRLYALRNLTGTVESLPLVVGSILSKKLALGASALVFDVKTGSGSFFEEEGKSIELAHQLVDTARELGCPAVALVSDMSQPVGSWAGHSCEVREALECLAGGGDERLRELTLSLAEAVLDCSEHAVGRDTLEQQLSCGAARETFERWAAAQGADLEWLSSPSFEIAPYEVVAEATENGYLASVSTRRLGSILFEAGAGRVSALDEIDNGVSLLYSARIGDSVARGQELARLYLRRSDGRLAEDFKACFEIASSAVAPVLVRSRV